MMSAAKRRTRVLALSLTIGVCWTGPARAEQLVKLSAAFSPDRPGSATTIHLGFKITSSNGEVPSPLTGLDIALPAGMGLGKTTLGEATCTAAILERRGPAGCPPNSLMGRGHALVELPLGPEVIRNEADISVFMAHAVNRHTTMLFYAESQAPVSAEITFQGQLLPDARRLGAHLDTPIPIIPTLPEARDAALVDMDTTLGPEHLTYYTRARGRRVGYRPVGMAVPPVCPRGGYPFSSTLSFQDATTAQAKSSVACAPGAAHRRRAPASRRRR